MSTSNFSSKADPGRFLANRGAPESRKDKTEGSEKTRKFLVCPKMFCGLFLLLAVLYPVFSMAAALTVSWDPNEEPDIAGYKVFYGTASRVYTESVTLDSPDQTSCTVEELAGGYTYYFAVKAFDLGGQESEYSDEVYQYIPLPNSPPTAAIQVNTNHGTAPLEVLFDAGASSDPDGNIAEYTWSFGDGGSGAGVNAAHVYTTPGSYTVALTVTDTVGASDTATLVVQIDQNSPPIARVALSTMSGYAPLLVDFDAADSSDSDGSIVEYTWDFGDETSGEGVSVYHLYGTPGTYTICLTVRDDKGETASTYATIEVRQGYEYTWRFGDAPEADFKGTVEDTYINLNEENTADSERLEVYTWPTDSVANAIVMKWDLAAIPADAEIKEAILRLYLAGTDGDGGDELYDVSAHRLVNHNPTVSLCSGFTYDGLNAWTPNGSCYEGIPMAQADILPADDMISIDKTAGYKSWSIAGMARHWVSIPVENLGLLLNADTSAGAESNRYFASSENEEASRRPSLTVTFVTSEPLNLPPKAGMTAEPSSGLAPLTVAFGAGTSSDPDGTLASYHWDFGDGASAEGIDASHTFTVPGTYTAVLTVTDDAGATDSTPMVIEVGANVAPVAVISAQPLAGKAPLAVDVSGEGSADGDGSIVSYTWDLGDGTAAEGYSISHVYELAGTYTIMLTVTDDKGSTGQASIVVSAEANAAPEIAAFSATPTLLENPNGKVTFETTATDPEGDELSYLLEFGDGATATVLPATYRYKVTGIYEAVLTVTDSHGNQATSAVTITVDDTRPNKVSNVTIVLSQ
jgi:PKD repeat protein